MPWQTNSTFIASFISSQILSKARKYWVCGVFVVFAVFSFVLKSGHISSIVWYKNWHKSLKSGMLWHKNLRIFLMLGIAFQSVHARNPA